MRLIRILICGLVSLISSVVTESLVNNKIYFIRNAADSSYLKVPAEGRLCQVPQTVVTANQTDFENSYAEKWLYRYDVSENYEYGPMILAQGNFQLNEVSLDSPSPHCYPYYQEYEMIEIHTLSGDKQYQIKHKTFQKCLTNMGSGQEIEWQDCDIKSTSQQWRFEETSI